MSENLRGVQALVTGAGGFIASHLVEALINDGANVRAFVRYNSRGDPGLLKLLPKNIYDQLEIIAGDLRDLTAVQSAMRDINLVFHLGALIAIPYSYLHPAEVVETNVIGTLNILLAGRMQNVDRIVHTSSSEVYGTALNVPINETHPLQGQSPYSASKIGADKLVESFYRSYDLPVVTLRPFNTYGPRQSARAVIPSIIIQALTHEVIYLGNLEAKRDLTFITDTIDGFRKVAEVESIEGDTFNLGTGQEVRIDKLAEEILNQIGKKIEIRVDKSRLRPGKSEVQRLLADNTLAKERLNWAPSINLGEGIYRTIRWIEANQHLYQESQYQI